MATLDTLPADVVEILDSFTRRNGGHYPASLPGAAVPVHTLADARALAGNYFSRDARRFFRAQSHGGPAGRGFFVESIRCDWHDDTDTPDARQYRVSWLSRHPDGVGVSVEHSRDFDTLDDARAARRTLARHYPRQA